MALVDSKSFSSSTGNTPAQMLDTRVKVLSLGVLSLAIWSVDTPAGLGLTALLCLFWLALSGKCALKVLDGLRRLWLLFLAVIIYYYLAGYSLGAELSADFLPQALGRGLMLCGKLAA